MSQAFAQSSSNTALSKKERHYAHLAAKLETLSQTFQATHHNITVAAQQAHYVRNIGISQASTFMSAHHTILQEGEAAAEGQKPQDDLQTQHQ